MGSESFDGQMRIDKLKNTYISHIIGPRGLQCETNLDCESFDVVTYGLWPLLHGQMRVAKL